MVTLEFSFSNSAVQASCAACWAVEPAPAISPETSPPPPAPAEVEPPVSLSLLDPHAATPRARARVKATTTSHLELDISLPLRIVRHSWHGGSQRSRSSLLPGGNEDVKKV